MNDIKSSHFGSPLQPIKISRQQSTTNENPLHESSDSSDDPANTPKNLLELFHHHLSIQNFQKIPTMTRFKIFPQRKINFFQSTKNKNNTSNTSSLHVTPLSHYSTTISNSNETPSNTSSSKDMNESPVKLYSETNYPFPPPFFRPGHSDS